MVHAAPNKLEARFCQELSKQLSLHRVVLLFDPAEQLRSLLDALAIEADPAAVRQAFLAQWPAGTDAHASYFERIEGGPDYQLHQVIRRED